MNTNNQIINIDISVSNQSAKVNLNFVEILNFYAYPKIFIYKLKNKPQYLNSNIYIISKPAQNNKSIENSMLLVNIILKFNQFGLLA